MTERYRYTAAAVMFAVAALCFVLVAAISGPWYWWLLALVFVAVAITFGLSARKMRTG